MTVFCCFLECPAEPLQGGLPLRPRGQGLDRLAPGGRRPRRRPHREAPRPQGQTRQLQQPTDR